MPRLSRINELSELPDFRETLLCQNFLKEPLGFVDIGARGGTHPLADPIAELVHVIGFEPDEAAFKILESEKKHSPFAKIEYSQFALAEREGTHPLYLCNAETNHSLRPPNEAFCQRYNMVKFACEGETVVNCETLDRLFLPGLDDQPHLAEFIKIDTQGTEHEILRGAETILRRQTVALFVEVSFSPIYGGQSHFSELEVYLRQLGFVFHGFDHIHYRSRKALDIHQEAGRERLLFSDAVFFKDPREWPGKRLEEGRSSRAIFLCALVLGYFDFAIELLPLVSGSERERDCLRKVVHHCAGESLSNIIQPLNKLQEEIHKIPEQTNVLVGSFVDLRRPWPRYTEIASPHLLPEVEASPLSFTSTNAISGLPSFRETLLFQEFRSQPLGFTEVGVRQGIHPMAQPMAELLAVLAFVSDPQEATRLQAEIHGSPYQKINVQACTLARHNGVENLHLLGNKTNNSFLEPNEHLIRRYHIQGFDPIGTASVPCRSLDSLLRADLAGNPSWGEFLKIDAPSAEYDILNGGIQVLREQTVALVVKAYFLQVYKKQTCFSELELWLRSQGFTLYGFHQLNYCPQEHLDKKTEIGRERPFFADAVFFRDPFDGINDPHLITQRQVKSLIVTSILLRYYDFAIELLKLLESPKSDRALMETTIHQIAFISSTQSAQEVDTLHRIVMSHSDWAQILIGQFVDRRSELHTSTMAPELSKKD